ncbi:hypothetical protein Tco_0211045 [Tanacetum coccineum]
MATIFTVSPPHLIQSSLFISSLPKTSSIKITCSSLSSSAQLTTVNESVIPLATNCYVNNDIISQKWEGYRKRKVLMRVGYVAHEGLEYGVREASCLLKTMVKKFKKSSRWKVLSPTQEDEEDEEMVKKKPPRR